MKENDHCWFVGRGLGTGRSQHGLPGLLTSGEAIAMQALRLRCSAATFHRGMVVPVSTHNVHNEKGRLATAFYSLLHILILHALRNCNRIPGKSDRRLCLQPAFHRCTSPQGDRRFRQYHSLHVCTRSNDRTTCDLPEDVLGQCANQGNIRTRGQGKNSRYLENPDIRCVTREGDSPCHADIATRGTRIPSVGAGGEVMPAGDTSSEQVKIGGTHSWWFPGGVVVRSNLVVLGRDHFSRSSASTTKLTTRIVGCVYPSSHLSGCRKVFRGILY